MRIKPCSVIPMIRMSSLLNPKNLSEFSAEGSQNSLHAVEMAAMFWKKFQKSNGCSICIRHRNSLLIPSADVNSDPWQTVGSPAWKKLLFLNFWNRFWPSGFLWVSWKMYLLLIQRKRSISAIRAVVNCIRGIIWSHSDEDRLSLQSQHRDKFQSLRLPGTTRCCCRSRRPVDRSIHATAA